jgi:hypothetical protein
MEHFWRCLFRYPNRMKSDKRSDFVMAMLLQDGRFMGESCTGGKCARPRTPDRDGDGVAAW